MVTISKITNPTGTTGNGAKIYEFSGESTDTKPTENIPVNSLFLELDKKETYYFDGTTWKKVGWNSSSD